MSEKISIAGLREQAEVVIEASDGRTHPESHDDYTLALAVLPLLDAVGAAERLHTYIANVELGDIPWDEGREEDLLWALQGELLGFDFGDENT